MKYIPATFPTFEDAASRVQRLKRQGIWPAIVGPRPDGTYRLTFDPGDPGDSEPRGG